MTLWSIPLLDTFDAILDTSPEVIDNFFDSQGILVVTGNNTDEPLNLEEKLNLPVTAADTELAFASNDDAIIDPGIDIATIYYKHGNVFSVHEINVGSNDTVDRNALIEEVFYKNSLWSCIFGVIYSIGDDFC